MTASELFEPVTEFIRKQSRITVALVALLIVFTVSALVAVMVQAGRREKTPVTAPYDETFVPIDEFLAPSAPAIVEDHYYVRQKDGQWDEQDVSRWFTDVDSPLLDSLSQANAALTGSLLEAAP